MAPIFSSLISSGSKTKDPRYVCLSEAKASLSQRIWTEVSSSVPHFLQMELLSEGVMSIKQANNNPGLCPFNLLTPNDDYSGRTAPLTSKCFILYIYSTNIGTENFKHGIYSPFIPLQNAVCFINLTCLVPVLFTFYIQSVLKLKKKIILAPKG